MRPGALAPVGIAVLSAALFGAATPLSKLLLDDFTPFQLAGLLYLGAALGVAPTAWRGGRPRLPARTDLRNRYRLFGAVVSGGIAGPVFLLLGLRSAEAASVSLWLNFELAATAVLGVLFFREQLGRLGWTGVATAFFGSTILAFDGGIAGARAACFVLIACVCWGLDNHLTALIDGITPSQSTFWKGLAAGVTNLAIGAMLDPLARRVRGDLGVVCRRFRLWGEHRTLYFVRPGARCDARPDRIRERAVFWRVVVGAAARRTDRSRASDFRWFVHRGNRAVHARTSRPCPRPSAARTRAFTSTRRWPPRS